MERKTIAISKNHTYLIEFALKWSECKKSNFRQSLEAYSTMVSNK